LPTTGEGHIKATPSPTYAAKKAALEDDQVRLSLELMEEAIVAEPDNWSHREQVGEVIWDRSEDGLALAYTVENGEVIYLTFIDLYLA
jgi:hypothetical protein